MKGVEFTNITIEFSNTRPNEIDDGTVMLVTPTRDMKANGLIFERFLSAIQFYKH